MEVTYEDKMGSDIDVVNAARVSFNKRSLPSPMDKGLKKKDIKLLNFLAKHGHWTPFGHVYLKVHIKAPIFVARQLVKHQVGLVWNEVSRRYVDYEPEFYTPETWRARADNVKQGSSEDITCDKVVIDEYGHEVDTSFYVGQACEQLGQVYNNLLKAGVAPEQARIVLPHNLYTEWVWSGTLMAFARICQLRQPKDAQLETRVIADQIAEIAEYHFPHSWDALFGEYE